MSDTPLSSPTTIEPLDECGGRALVEVERFLATAIVVPGGRCLDGNNPIIDDVLAAIAVEVHGYMKLDEERDGRARTTPKRGSTAARLLTVYDHIERQLT